MAWPYFVGEYTLISAKWARFLHPLKRVSLSSLSRDFSWAQSQFSSPLPASTMAFPSSHQSPHFHQEVSSSPVLLFAFPKRNPSVTSLFEFPPPPPEPPLEPLFQHQYFLFYCCIDAITILLSGIWSAFFVREWYVALSLLPTAQIGSLLLDAYQVRH